ncbi:MAG: S1 RNA-binding domain-containing protein, partial [Anaerolineae bacterium]|nr:S1 RNA-binding domain-containing protein [Anaerolineae bacterium]
MDNSQTLKQLRSEADARTEAAAAVDAAGAKLPSVEDGVSAAGEVVGAAAAAEAELTADLASQPAAGASMADYVDDFQYKPLKAGETRDGIIVSIKPGEILVDVGAKSEGVISQRELERLGKDYLESLQVGDQVVVYVVRPEDKDGNIVLSLARAQQERDWREAERLLESNESFQSTIIGYNRGGVICRVGKLRGFIPASQLVTKPEGDVDENDEHRYASLVNKQVWLK